MIDENPYVPPNSDAETARTNPTRSTTAAVASVVFAFIVMFGLHHGVAAMGHDARRFAFAAFAFLYLVWPFLAWLPPRSCLFGMIAFPLFGIWLGLSYTGDIGSQKITYSLPYRHALAA